MEIQGKTPPVSGKQAVQSVKPLDKATKAQKRSISSGDRVELSAEAKLLQAAHEQVKKMPAVDADKVAQIKAQLQKGTYQPNAEKTASTMVDESLMDKSD